MLNLGIQSYCFRTFTEHADLVRAMKQADLSYIELCSRHLHYDWPVQEQEKGQRYLKENGIIINGYGQVRFTVDDQPQRDNGKCGSGGLETDGCAYRRVWNKSSYP